MFEALLPYAAEFFGTAMLIILGTGVVANVTLSKSGMKGAGPIMIAIAWGLAVMLPAFIFGRTSGAHFNPALTLAFAIDGSISWDVVPGYLVAQFLGAFCGACIVYLMFKDHFDAEDDAEKKRGVFTTAPSIRNIGRNLFSEAVATFILVFTLKAIPGHDLVDGMGSFLVFAIIMGLGMSLGGLTGYALNPARDWGPRLAHTVLPIKGKTHSDWKYAIVPLVGPIVGAICAVLLYDLFLF